VSLDAVYVTYWSLLDPLCQSQSLPVVRALTDHGFRLALVSFEQGRWRLGSEEEARQRRALAEEGIRWEPLPYHRRPAILSTLFDMARGVGRCLRVARRERPRLFHGRGTVAAAIAGAGSRLSGARFLNDADGPLSQEYVDAGVWRAGSLPHRMTRWAETRLLQTADAVAVLTERRRAEVRSLTLEDPVVLPCAVDVERFTPDPRAREAIRRELDLAGVVFVYAGKADGWYLTNAMFEFVQKAGVVLGEVSLLVLTTEAPERFSATATSMGIRHTVCSVSRDEMPRYLSAADAGLSFVLAAPSKTACSPVKNGEYLACGLPIVTTPGIGDYSDLVVRRSVGVVVAGCHTRAYETAAGELRTLLADPSLGARCRETARAEVGLAEILIPRYIGLYERLLGASTTRGARKRSASSGA
jgi:glycosyltransferase involved in cell wall biosynthesis